MLIPFPGDQALRKRAVTWLLTENIRHTWLFQAVMIDDADAATRFRQWVQTQGRET